MKVERAASVIFLTILFFISCSTNNTSISINDDSIFVLDSLKPTVPHKNEWITTRIHSESKLNADKKVIKSFKGSELVLEYQYFRHSPHVNDDEFWKTIFIYIPDTSVIKSKINYTVPNNNIVVLAEMGGAWLPPRDYKNITGLIRFETFDSGSTLVSLNLIGTINREEGLVMGNFLSGQIKFIKNGLPDWEYKEEYEQVDLSIKR